jgi:hypothetical protein
MMCNLKIDIPLPPPFTLILQSCEAAAAALIIHLDQTLNYKISAFQHILHKYQLFTPIVAFVLQLEVQ